MVVHKSKRVVGYFYFHFYYKLLTIVFFIFTDAEVNVETLLPFAESKIKVTAKLTSSIVILLT